MRFTYWLMLGGLTAIASLAVGLRDGPPRSEPKAVVPSWAQVAPEQIAEARSHGVPVAFENDLGMRFVLIPAGTFWMGSPRAEAGRGDHETHRKVALAKPFYMQITEVSNAQFRQFSKSFDSGGIRSSDNKRHSLNGPMQPAVNLSWRYAVEFAVWLSEQDLLRAYLLPTELQWERACRAGTRTAYGWGDSASEGWRHANASDPLTEKMFGLEAGGWLHDDGHRIAADVGSYAANRWGIHDLHGNVSEYCADWYDEAYRLGHAVRGGCWAAGSHRARCAHREQVLFDHGGRPVIGFRLISQLPEKGE